MSHKLLNRRALQASMLALAAAANQALAVDKSFMTSNGTWNVAGNWNPLGAPNGGDNVFIGNTAAAENGYAYLSANADAGNLVVNDGMELRTNLFRMTVAGNATFSGKNDVGVVNYYTTLQLDNSANAYDFRSTNLTVADQARLDFRNGTLRVDGLLDMLSTTFIDGSGTINLFGNGPAAMVMNGRMTIDADGMTINQFGTGRVDLDGTLADNNLINVTGYTGDASKFAFLEINGTTLNDAYNERIWVGGGNRLDMNLSDGWTLGTGGHIEFLAPLAGNMASQVNGGTATINGLLDVGPNAHLEFNAPSVLAAGSQLTIGEDADVAFDGATTLNGVTVTSEQGGDLTFSGPLTVISGSVSSYSTNWFDGDVYIDGPTNYRGNITYGGVVRQNGDATVSLATIINGERFSMSGVTPFSAWTINAPLQVNTARLGVDSSVFSGDMTVNAANPLVPAYVEINLSDNDNWTLLGSMTLNGPGNGLIAQSVRGSDLVVGGTLTVNGNNATQAKIEVREAGLSHGYVNIASNSSLRLDGGSIADPNTITGGRILGAGTLRASGDHALVGFGTISTGVNFTGAAELRADNGYLHVGGPIADVGVIGTADSDGVLFVQNSWNTTVADRVELLGGELRGGVITNGGLIVGRGLVFPLGLSNPGTIAADGGGLTLTSVFANQFDLDGAGGTGVVSAIAGDITANRAPNGGFGGTANVGAGRTLHMVEGWTLNAGGTLNMAGAPGNLAIVEGTSQTIAGAVNVAGAARFDLNTNFAAGSQTSLPATGDRLLLTGNNTVGGGAAFMGDGSVRFLSDSVNVLDDGASVGVLLYNSGTTGVAGDLATGIATTHAFEQSDLGQWRSQFGSTTPGTGYDRVDVATDAVFNGALQLEELGSYDPQYLVTHEIFRAGSVSGYFDTVPANKIAANKYWAVTYDNESVFATAALPGDANLDGSVDISDFAILASQFNTAGPWAEGNFNGDLLADIGDFALLGANFNVSVPLARPFGGLNSAGSSVPEPGTGLAAVCMMFGLGQRTRRRIS